MRGSCGHNTCVTACVIVCGETPGEWGTFNSVLSLDYCWRLTRYRCHLALFSKGCVTLIADLPSAESCRYIRQRHLCDNPFTADVCSMHGLPFWPAVINCLHCISVFHDRIARVYQSNPIVPGTTLNVQREIQGSVSIESKRSHRSV